MNLSELFNQIHSKKTTIAVVSLCVAAYIKAPPEQATIIACVAIVTQGIIDFYKIRKGVKNESKNNE